jgi:spore coat protein H
MRHRRGTAAVVPAAGEHRSEGQQQFTDSFGFCPVICRRDWSLIVAWLKLPRINRISSHALLAKLGLAALLTTAAGQHARAADAKAGDELFADGALAHLRIEVTPPAMEILRRYAFRREAQQEERESARCTVREGTNVWSDVAIHLKGSLGSFRAIDDTPSFTLNFSKHLSRQRFHGLEKISLNASIQDPTRLSEKFCRELYTRGGIPVPRAGYATAEINGRRLGVYVLLEGWNKQFIERHFADARGPLYEGRFLSDIDQPPLIAYGRAKGGSVSIPRLLAAAQETNPPKRMARLEAVLDVERFTRLLALDLLTWNGDGYAMHVNNYRIFHDRKKDRLVFLAHGLDQMFTLPDAPLLAGGDGSVAWALLSLPEGRRRVLEQIRELRHSLFQPEAMRRRVMELASPVGLALGREAGLSNTAPPAHSEAVRSWVQLMTERIASIDQQLAGISNLVSLPSGQSLVPPTWTSRAMAGAPVLLQPTDPPSLNLRTATGSAGAWVAIQWLEHGRYRLQGRVRQAPTTTNQMTCGFRVCAPRKRSLGIDWGWDGRRRVSSDERFNLAYQPLPSAAGTNWIELVCEIDVRQPVAELEIRCEASGDGEASFDLSSLRLTRLTDPGRD